ncbi:MAG: O-antigen ligase family protein [Patescibacteria group bacterium]|nr:O-antigen ligase family protein [Patescibacteria group bacterium]MDD5554940.1 O-antigen ligase family protein [Patescibacteria group bacterium]
MEKKIKIFFFSLLLLSVFFLFLALPGLDWQNDWFFVVASLFFIILLVVGFFSLEKLIILLIIALPTFLKLNNFKLDVAKYFPSLKYYNLPINLTAIICSFLILLGIMAVFWQWPKVKTLPLKFILLLYSIFLIISMAWSENLSASLSGLVYSLAPLAIYIITYSYFSNHQGLIKIILASLISALAPLAIAVWQIATGAYFFEPDSSLARITGPFVHPNLFGLYLFIILGLTFSYFLAKKNKGLKNNFFLFLFAAAMAVILILTYSRVSWACLVLFLLIFTVLARYLLIFLAVLAPLAFFILAIFESIRSRVTETFASSFFNSWIARKNIWRVSWEEIMKKPIFGHGIGTSEMVIENAKNWRGGTSLPHSDFFLYGLELGFLGAVFFLSYTIGAIYYAGRTFLSLPDGNIKINAFGQEIEINFKTLAFGVLALLLSLILASFFESVSREIATQIIVWAVLGSLFSLKK